MNEEMVKSYNKMNGKLEDLENKFHEIETQYKSVCDDLNTKNGEIYNLTTHNKELALTKDKLQKDYDKVYKDLCMFSNHFYKTEAPCNMTIYTFEDLLKYCKKGTKTNGFHFVKVDTTWIHKHRYIKFIKQHIDIYSMFPVKNEIMRIYEHNFSPITINVPVQGRDLREFIFTRQRNEEKYEGKQ